ncbi:MAG: hypothetical protein ACOC7L_02030 [Acidobacteriota bacterium]
MNRIDVRTLVICSLLLVTLAPGVAAADAGASPPPSDPSPEPSSGLETVCLASAADVLASAAPMLGGVGSLSTCTATAECDGYQISCEGDSECTAVDRDCSVGERGFVDCDGNVTACDDPCDTTVCGDGVCEDGEEDSCLADCGSQCPPCIICPCDS